MKKTIAIAFAALALCLSLRGQEYSNDVAVTNLEFAHDGEDLVVKMDLDFSRYEFERNQAVYFTPVIFGGNNYTVLPTATIYSRGYFYHRARAERSSDVFSPEEWEFYRKDIPSPVHYIAVVGYLPWMSEAKLRIDRQAVNCCGKEGRITHGHPILSARIPEPEPEPEPEPAPGPALVNVPEFVPHYIYVLPDAETTVKERDISGEAYVVFASGSTAVDPSYENNASELGKIRATVDSVRNDADMTITRIILRGYSSPDGSYAVNEKLAAARTEAIREYVSGLYELPDDIYLPESVAENWDGLRKEVEQNPDFPSREKVLSILDSNAAPDKKEARIKSNYPSAWKYLVQEVFPGLRRTDYKVSYTVRSYTTAEDARRIMETRPQNLSINEFFLAAQGYNVGSREFNHVFSVAARVYPDDEIVNINAANAAMSLGSMDRAAFYLHRIGDGPVALYTKGIYYALTGDWVQAGKLFTAAEVAGIEDAAPALESVSGIVKALEENRKALEEAESASD